MNIKSKKGFTFVETMVVVAVLSVIAMVLGGVVNNGISIWNRVDEIAFEEDAAIFVDKLTLDLKNAVRFQGMDFMGNNVMMSVPSMTISEDGQSLPGMITYRYVEKDGTVTRESKDYISFVQKKEGKGKEILSGVESFFFFYCIYDELQEIYVWTEELPEILPQSVRVKMDLRNKNGNVIPYVKTINIPVAKIEFSKE